MTASDPVTPPPVLRPRLSELVELAEEGRGLMAVAQSEEATGIDWMRWENWLRKHGPALLSVTALCGALAAAVEALAEAPHGVGCGSNCSLGPDGSALPCGCWKAAALAHINQLVDTEGSE